MDGYNHYIRVNQAGIIVYGFSSAFEEPLPGDHLYIEDGPRHFTQVWPEPLTNDRGQYLYRLVGDTIEQRSQDDLDAEWAARPSTPSSPEQRIGELEAESVQTMLAVAGVYETVEADNATREEEGVNTMLGLTEAYDTIMQQQVVIDDLIARVAALERVKR